MFDCNGIFGYILESDTRRTPEPRVTVILVFLMFTIRL